MRGKLTLLNMLIALAKCLKVSLILVEPFLYFREVLYAVYNKKQQTLRK